MNKIEEELLNTIRAPHFGQALPFGHLKYLCHFLFNAHQVWYMISNTCIIMICMMFQYGTWCFTNWKKKTSKSPTQLSSNLLVVVLVNTVIDTPKFREPF